MKDASHPTLSSTASGCVHSYSPRPSASYKGKRCRLGPCTAVVSTQTCTWPAETLGGLQTTARPSGSKQKTRWCLWMRLSIWRNAKKHRWPPVFTDEERLVVDFEDNTVSGSSKHGMQDKEGILLFRASLKPLVVAEGHPSKRKGPSRKDLRRQYSEAAVSGAEVVEESGKFLESVGCLLVALFTRVACRRDCRGRSSAQEKAAAQANTKAASRKSKGSLSLFRQYILQYTPRRAQPLVYQSATTGISKTSPSPLAVPSRRNSSLRSISTTVTTSASPTAPSSEKKRPHSK